MFADVNAPMLQRLLALPETKALAAEVSAIGEDCICACEGGVADALLTLKAHIVTTTPKMQALLSAIITHEITESTTAVKSPFAQTVVELGEAITSSLVASLEHEAGLFLDAMAARVKAGALRQWY